MFKENWRLVICDDHEGIRRTLSDYLETQPGLDVIALCKTGAEAIEMCLSEKPDILFLDINMPESDGFTTARRLKSSGSETRIIGFSILNSPFYAEYFIDAGAHGYLTKTSPPEEILTAIEKVLQGEKYICNEIRNAP